MYVICTVSYQPTQISQNCLIGPMIDQISYASKIGKLNYNAIRKNFDECQYLIDSSTNNLRLDKTKRFVEFSNCTENHIKGTL